MASSTLAGGKGTTGHQREGYAGTCPRCGARRVDAQFGLEPTPGEYVARLVELFRELRRALRDDGTIWINIGDSYNGSGGAGGDYAAGGLRDGQPKYKGRNVSTLKPKDLCMIPARVAIALCDDGWWLRSEIVWHKRAPMPESVTDRPTRAHEMVYLLSKRATYYYDADAVREPMSEATRARDAYGFNGAFRGQFNGTPGEERWQNGRPIEQPSFYNEAGRNRRSVWTLGPESYRGAHFAVMPTKLVEPCIKAGCPVGGVVLDPFMGSGTVAAVAASLGRHYIGFELNPAYIDLAEERLRGVCRPLLPEAL